MIIRIRDAEYTCKQGTEICDKCMLKFQCLTAKDEDSMFSVYLTPAAIQYILTHKCVPNKAKKLYVTRTDTES
jgi:hypothetical protein